jgi:mono/diheme cytochrome c family protein
VAGVPTRAQEEGAGFKAMKGRTTFRLYCASCHGRDGEGDGNVAQFLTVPPADLTRIEMRHGEWPDETLREIIDGRQAVKGHGNREMPIWGDVFQSPWGDETPVEGEEGEERARRKIDELVVFLKTIQVAE